MPDPLHEKHSKVLELNTRKRVYNTVRNNAGCHFRELQRRSSLSVGSVRYHLDYLKKNGLIIEEKQDNNTTYFPAEFKIENKRIMILLRQKSIRNILLFIVMNNQPNHEQIVKEVKLSPSTVSWHLKKLHQSGIINMKKEGRKTYFSLKADKKEIINLLITFQESFMDTIVDRIIEMWDV